MPAKKIIKIFENSHSMANFMLKEWIKIAFDAINEKGKFSVALSGGNTPCELYSKLSGIKDFTLWDNTHIFQVDERFVPENDDDSNLKMIKDTFLNYVNIPLGNIHKIDTGADNVDFAANEYEVLLKDFFVISGNKKPSLDLVVLGVGEDGHTASLFPQDKNFKTEDHYIIPVSIEGIKRDRVSMTIPVINNAKNVFVMASGKKKAGIIKQIMSKGCELPAAVISSQSNEVHYCLDKNSASEFVFPDVFTHEEDHILVVV